MTCVCYSREKHENALLISFLHTAGIHKCKRKKKKKITAHIPFTTTNARKKTHTHTRKKAKVLSAFFFLV